MGRRYRRLRWLAQQVVTVTRRLWRLCKCCGTVTADPRQDVVPLAAILSNTKAARLKPGTPQRSTGFCCQCWTCTCFQGYRRQSYLIDEVVDDYFVESEDACTNVSRTLESDALHAEEQQSGGLCKSPDIVCGQKWFHERTTTDETYQEVKDQPRYLESSSGQIVEEIPHIVTLLALNLTESTDCLHPTADEETKPLSIRSSSSDSSCCSYQTDDNVALRYYNSAPVQQASEQPGAIQPVSSQTDDIVAIRYLYPRRSQIQRISSQTDDMVALRYYPRFDQLPTTSNQAEDMVDFRHQPPSSQIQQISAQSDNMMCTVKQQRSIHTDDFVPMRFCPRPFSVQRVSSQTDDRVAMRFYSAPPHVEQISIQTVNMVRNVSEPRSSQTDDFVPMRYYPRPSRVRIVSSQTDDMVAMRFHAEVSRIFDRPGQLDQVTPIRCISVPSILFAVSSQTDDDVAMRYLSGPVRLLSVSSQTDDHVAMRFYNEQSGIPVSPAQIDDQLFRTTPNEMYRLSSQTDDILAMRFLTEPPRSVRHSSQTDDLVAMRFYDDSEPPIRTSSQTDDLVAMRFYDDSELPIRTSSQTDDLVAMRFYDDSEPPIRTSSQTDDLVAMRFYDDSEPPIRTSSQTDDLVAMRFYNDSKPPIRKSSQNDDFVARRYNQPQLQSSSTSSQTDDNVAMRFYSVEADISFDLKRHACSTNINMAGPSSSYQRDEGQHPWRTRENPVPDVQDSSTSIEVRRRHWNVKNAQLSANDPGSAQVRTQLTLKFPLSEIPVPPVTKPDNLTVEFAVVDEWHRIYPVEWTKIQNIARTRTGSVDLTILGEYNRQIALKTLNAETSGLEAELLIGCQGPFVVQLCACMVQGTERYLCMTYYSRRDLAQWLRKDPQRKYFKETEATWVLAYIIAGVNFLHKKKIIHVDIKPANILIDNKGYPVIGDFGSAMRMIELADFVAYTPAYAAPEIHEGEAPCRQSDLWSVACIYYEILMKRVPYIGKFSMETEMRVSLGVALEASSMSAESKDYLCSELKLQKEERLGFKGTARRVMRHAVFKHIHWSDVKCRSRQLECRLFEIFKQIERDEFNRRNKPDPIPPDSIFYLPWSYYMRQQQQAPKAVKSYVNDSQIPSLSRREVNGTDTHPDMQNINCEMRNSGVGCAELGKTKGITPVSCGGYSSTNGDSRAIDADIHIPGPSSPDRDSCLTQNGPDHVDELSDAHPRSPEKESTIAVEGNTREDNSGTDIDYKPSHVLFHRPTQLDIREASILSLCSQDIRGLDGIKSSSQRSESDQATTLRLLGENGQSVNEGASVQDENIDDAVDQT